MEFFRNTYHNLVPPKHAGAAEDCPACNGIADLIARAVKWECEELGDVYRGFLPDGSHFVMNGWFLNEEPSDDVRDLDKERLKDE